MSRWLAEENALFERIFPSGASDERARDRERIRLERAESRARAAESGNTWGGFYLTPHNAERFNEARKVWEASRGRRNHSRDLCSAGNASFVTADNNFKYQPKERAMMYQPPGYPRENIHIPENWVEVYCRDCKLEPCIRQEMHDDMEAMALDEYKVKGTIKVATVATKLMKAMYRRHCKLFTVRFTIKKMGAKCPDCIRYGASEIAKDLSHYGGHSDSMAMNRQYMEHEEAQAFEAAVPAVEATTSSLLKRRPNLEGYPRPFRDTEKPCLCSGCGLTPCLILEMGHDHHVAAIAMYDAEATPSEVKDTLLIDTMERYNTIYGVSDEDPATLQIPPCIESMSCYFGNNRDLLLQPGHRETVKRHDDWLKAMLDSYSKDAKSQSANQPKAKPSDNSGNSSPGDETKERELGEPGLDIPHPPEVLKDPGFKKYTRKRRSRTALDREIKRLREEEDEGATVESLSMLNDVLIEEEGPEPGFLAKVKEPANSSNSSDSGSSDEEEEFINGDVMPATLVRDRDEGDPPLEMVVAAHKKRIENKANATGQCKRKPFVVHCPGLLDSDSSDDDEEFQARLLQSQKWCDELLETEKAENRRLRRVTMD